MSRLVRCFIRVLITGFVIAFITGCKYDAPVEMKMNLAEANQKKGSHFYDNGFPTNLRRQADGSINITDFPRQRHLLTAELVAAIPLHTQGYHTVSTVYLPFTGPLPNGLIGREPLFYAEPGSAIQVVDIDPTSPEYGRRFPLTVSMTESQGAYRPKHLLQIQPVLGVNLRPNTTYAAIVLNSPQTDGEGLIQNEQLRAVLADDDSINSEAREVYRPLRDYLHMQTIAVQSVVGATVWSTGDPGEKLHRGAEATVERVQQMETLPLKNLASLKEYEDYCVIRGDISIPMFQNGVAPYYLLGGQMEWDTAGDPVVQYWRDTEFVLTVPKRELMPESGFPILHYVHGAGGRAHQVYDRGPFDRIDFTQYPYYLGEEGKGPSMIAAQRGWASSGFAGHVSYDHVGEIAGLRGAVVYNLFNPTGLLASYYQMAWERIYFRHVLNRLELSTDYCPDSLVSESESAVRFNPDMQVTMGQSHGNWISSLVAAADPIPYQGAIFSGLAGTWTKLYANNQTYRLIMDAAVINQLPDGVLDDAHPFLTLLEWLLGGVDSTANVDSLLRYPKKTPPHIIAFSGYKDYFSTELTQRPFLMALGTDLLGPDIGESLDYTLMPHMASAGLQQLSYPLGSNRAVPGYGERTAVVMRYRGDNPVFGYTGHEITFQLEEIKHQYGCFLEQLSEGHAPVVDVGVQLGGACYHSP